MTVAKFHSYWYLILPLSFNSKEIVISVLILFGTGVIYKSSLKFPKVIKKSFYLLIFYLVLLTNSESKLKILLIFFILCHSYIKNYFLPPVNFITTLWKWHNHKASVFSFAFPKYPRCSSAIKRCWKMRIIKIHL